MRSSNSHWTDEDRQNIKKDFDAGQSYTDIAARYTKLKGFEIKRSAIAGVIHRLGHRASDRPKKPGRPPKPRQRRMYVPAKSTPVLRIVEAPPIEPQDYPDACSFDDMDFESRCNWIIQDQPQLYCGAAKPSDRKRPYCPWHARLGLKHG
jgi:hypothetical protein